MENLILLTNETINLKKYLNLEEIAKYFETHLLKIIFAIILISAYKKIRKKFKPFLVKFFRKSSSDNPGVATFFGSIIMLIIDIVIAIIAINLIGLKLQGMFAFFGGISVVVGFAFKDTLSNLFGGLMLLTFKPFYVGDTVEYNGYIGTVSKIEIFYTTLINFQNEEIIIPNANIVGNEIRNINVNEHRRLDLTVSAGYESDIDEVKSVLREIVERRKDDLFFIEDMPVTIGLANMGASSIDFDLKVYVRDGKYLDGKYYLNETIMKEFGKLGINIPYNILDVHLPESK